MLFLLGSAKIEAAPEDYLGSWRSLGAVNKDVVFVKEGHHLKGTWTMPYDAEGRNARMTIRLEGSERAGSIKGTYHGTVAAVGSSPEEEIQFDGSFDLRISEDLKKLKGTMTVPMSESESQPLELRRD